MQKNFGLSLGLLISNGKTDSHLRFGSKEIPINLPVKIMTLYHEEMYDVCANPH